MDYAEVLKLVRPEPIILISGLVLVLQLIAAIIHPVVFRLVSALTIFGVIGLALVDGTALDDQKALVAELVEMVAVLVIVLIGHGLIECLFKAMARASR
jgi:hypothetical protein